MTTTQAGALPEFVTAIDYADNQSDTTTNMIDVRVPIGTRLALQSQPAADWRDRLTVNLMRQGAGLTKTQIRALIAYAHDGIEPDPALFEQPAAAGVSDAGAPFGMLRTTCPYCEQGFAFDQPEADASDELVDQHLDAILRAAGSALRHYTMQKSKDDMRSALRRAILALRPQAVPMTDEQIGQMYYAEGDDIDPENSWWAYQAAVRSYEARLGITQRADGGEGE